MVLPMVVEMEVVEVKRFRGWRLEVGGYAKLTFGGKTTSTTATLKKKEAS